MLFRSDSLAAAGFSCAEGVSSGPLMTDFWCRGKHISYQRGKRNTTPGTSLLKLEGVDSTDAAQFYCGKRVAYVYRAQRTVRGSKVLTSYEDCMRTQLTRA